MISSNDVAYEDAASVGTEGAGSMDMANGDEMRDITNIVPAETNQQGEIVPAEPTALIMPNIVGLHLSEQHIELLTSPINEWHLNRMSKHVNTSWKLTALASELRMDKSQIEPYLENYNNVVEASFNFLVDWKQQMINNNTAWKQIIYSLLKAGVFPSPQHLMGVLDTLIQDL